MTHSTVRGVAERQRVRRPAYFSGEGTLAGTSKPSTWCGQAVGRVANQNWEIEVRRIPFPGMGLGRMTS